MLMTGLRGGLLCFGNNFGTKMEWTYLVFRWLPCWLCAKNSKASIFTTISAKIVVKLVFNQY